MQTQAIAFALLGLAALAEAVTFSKTVCITKYGGAPTSFIPSTTTTSSTSYSATMKSTTTSSITITPPAKTKTRTVYTKSTSTKTVQKTDTFSATSTEVAPSYTTTEIAWTTVTFSSTYTSWTYATTISVGTSSGFTALQVALASADYSADNRASDPPANQKRAASTPPPTSASKTKMAYGADGKFTCDPPSYPTSVQCTAKIEVVTVTTSTYSTRTTVKAPTPTVYVATTSTFIVTKTTNVADASTTVTAVSTSYYPAASTYTYTDYTTAWTQTTSMGPVVTEYAACKDPANYVQRIRGAWLMGWENGFGYEYTRAAQNAQECCAICESRGAFCGSWYFNANYASCNLVRTEGGVCNSTAYTSNLTTDRNEQYPNSTAGNSDCGQFLHGLYDDH